MNRRICVIGGSGFIGTRLIDRLVSKENHCVTIVDKANSSKYPQIVNIADVRSVQQLNDAVPDGSILINLAAEHRDDVSPTSLYEQVNVIGAKNICEIARTKNINTIIFTSSVAVYGFAEIGTSEEGSIEPYNDYGRTKYEAENLFIKWQAESKESRSIVIIRPTVVFGENNRGNVYNLIRQIASKKFVMVGAGKNRKSLAYVENVAAFIEHCISFKPGVHIYNYIDKPDFTMNEFVSNVYDALNMNNRIAFRIPFCIGAFLGLAFDFISFVLNKKFPISLIRIKKFCANSVYETKMEDTGFYPPISLLTALERTVKYEFCDRENDKANFLSK